MRRGRHPYRSSWQHWRRVGCKALIGMRGGLYVLAYSVSNEPH